mmetsp:Transcript_615/g.1048  ORF Transcript_615/g.1048 Transcript_615/m.1048 type:complete len:488 (+) Transcript_615:69-1532(+)
MDCVVIAGSGAGIAKKSASKLTNKELARDEGISVFNLKSSAGSVACFRDCTTVKNGICVVSGARTGANGLAGDHILAVQENKNTIKSWSWKKEQVEITCTSPEKLGPVCATSCGTFIIAGGVSGSCYLWEAGSGELIRVWKSHYRSVSALRFVDDDSCLVSGGDDSLVHLWMLSDLLDSSISLVRSCRTFSDHTLPITSIWLGSFGLNSRMITSSLDQSVKLWSLNDSAVITSLVLPCAITCCVSDSLECWVFAGGVDGNIYQCDLRIKASVGLQHPSKKQKTSSASSSGLAGVYSRIFEGHTSAVSCINISPSGLLVVSGSLDGTCRVWDTFSGQSVKVVKPNDGARPIAALCVVPIPSEVSRGHGKGSMIKNAGEKKVAVPAFKALHRYKAPSQKKDAVFDFRAAGRCGSSVSVRDFDVQSFTETCQKNATPVVLNGSGPAVSSGKRVASGDRMQDLDRENTRLRSLSTKLYSIAVDRFLDSQTK